MHKNKSSITTYLQASIDKIESGNFIIGKNRLGRVYVKPYDGNKQHNEYFIRLPEIGETIYRDGCVRRDIEDPITVRGYTKNGNIITDIGIVLYSNVFRMTNNQRKVILVPKSVNDIVSGRYLQQNAEFNDFGTKIIIRDEDDTIKQTISTYFTKSHYYIVHPLALVNDMQDIRFEIQKGLSIDSVFSDPITMHGFNYMLKMCNCLLDDDLYTIRELQREIDYLSRNIQNRKSKLAEVILRAQARSEL